MKPTASLVIVTLLLSLAVACGGSGASPNPTPRPEDSVDIDPNLLTAVGLQPSDMPAGYAPDLSFNPPGGAATGYSAAYRLNGVTITSNVIKYPDTASRDKDLTHLRNGFAKLIGPESGYRLAGSDAAFLYSGGNLPAQATIMLRGRYLVTVSFQTQTTSGAAAVTNLAELDRLSALVFGRLERLLADPSSATAVVGAPTFDPQRAGGGLIATATP